MSEHGERILEKARSVSKGLAALASRQDDPMDAATLNGTALVVMELADTINLLTDTIDALKAKIDTKVAEAETPTALH